MLGLVGGLAGVVVGRIVERTLPLLISRFFHMDIQLGWNLAASAQGIAVGLLTTLLFTLPPLLAIRKIRPALILRRDMPEANDLAQASGDARASGGRRDSAGDRWPRRGWRTRRRRGYFAGGLTVALILLAVFASVFLRLIRVVLKRTPWRILRSRAGFANSSPGQSGASHP